MFYSNKKDNFFGEGSSEFFEQGQKLGFFQHGVREVGATTDSSKLTPVNFNRQPYTKIASDFPDAKAYHRDFANYCKGELSYFQAKEKEAATLNVLQGDKLIEGLKSFYGATATGQNAQTVRADNLKILQARIEIESKRYNAEANFSVDIDKQEFVNRGLYDSGLAAAYQNYEAAKLTAQLNAASAIKGKFLDANIQKLATVLEDDKMFYQKRSDENSDRAAFVAEGAIRQYLVEANLAKYSSVSWNKDDMKVLGDNGINLPQEIKIPDFTNLEVSSLAYKRQAGKGGSQKVTDEFELYYIPDTTQKGFKSYKDGVASMMHETDSDLIEEKRKVIKRNGSYVFADTGETLSLNEQEDLYAGYALQGAYQTSDSQGVLQAVYQKYDAAKEDYFSNSLPASMKGDFDTTFSFIEDEYTRRWVTKFASPYLDQSGLMGILLRAITSAYKSGLLDSALGGEDKSDLSVMEDITKDMSSEDREALLIKIVLKNAEGIIDPEQKAWFKAIADGKIEIAEKTGDLANITDGDYQAIVDKISSQDIDTKEIEKMIKLSRGDGGVGDTSVDTNLITDPAKQNDYLNILREDSEAMSKELVH